MLHQIGRGPAKEGDLFDSLAACHQRIRSFIELARVVAERADASPPEIADACVRVARYFREALPLHVADEEQSILPRLSDPKVGEGCLQALRTMHQEHDDHVAPLAELVAACELLGAEPTENEARRRLGELVVSLQEAFERHLVLEETHIFPALRQHLTDADRAAIADEMRARRA